MKISMYQASIPVPKRMLGNLADVLQYLLNWVMPNFYFHVTTARA